MIGHGSKLVEEGRAKCPDRLEEPFALLKWTAKAEGDSNCRRPSREGHETRNGCQCVRSCGGEFAVQAEHFARPVERVSDQPYSSGPTECSWNLKSVTIPKLPPPPRTPQNRSVCSLALAVSTSPRQ